MTDLPLPKPDAAFLRLLGDPKVRAEMLKAVKRKAPEKDREDLVQMALLRAVERFALFPEGDGPRLKYLCGMVRRMAMKKAKRRQLEAQHTPMLVTGEEEFAGHDEAKAHDARDILRRIFKDGEWTPTQRRMMTWLVRNAVGDSYAFIAGEEGVTEDHVKKEASQARALLRERAIPVCIGIAIVVFLFAVLHRDVSHSPDEANPNPAPTHVEPTPAPVGPAAPDAAKLREDGLAACAAKDWSTCLDDLDQAKVIDPAGDARADVQAARKLANTALVSPSKKGPDKMPPAH
jgi:DNA-directed RNA polymerase specialized sigma24 family protein